MCLKTVNFEKWLRNVVKWTVGMLTHYRSTFKWSERKFRKDNCHLKIQDKNREVELSLKFR